VNVTADVSVTASFKPTLNVDGSDWPSGYSLLVDGVIVTRYMQGLRGTPLTQGLTDVTATITHTAQIANYLDSLGALLDIDGDGETKPSTDGLLILRFMLGLRGGALVADAVGANATRPTAAEIEAWLNALLPTVVGVCGSANGITSTTPPSTTLCSAGSPSSVTSGVSSFIWTCNGSIANSNADDVSCAAPRQ